MKTILIAGLGNPGKKYEKTRHNAGFMFVDYFWKENRENFGFSDWEFKKNLNAEISIGKMKKPERSQEQICNLLRMFKKLGAGCKPAPALQIILLKPQTFMNLSGEAVQKAVKYYKIPCRGETSTSLIIAHDDIDLPLGKYKISQNSSSAGHNGAQNIIDMLGTKEFARLRIGVENREDKKIETEKYVLGKFGKEEISIILKLLPNVSEEISKNIILSSRA